MVNLPLIESRYPDQFPTYDISQFLVNGAKEFGPGSVTATVEASHVSWDIRLDTSAIVDADNRYFFQNLPAELLPEVGGSAVRYGTLPAFQKDVGAVVLELHSDGTLHLPAWGNGIADGTNKNVVCQATYVRRAS